MNVSVDTWSEEEDASVGVSADETFDSGNVDGTPDEVSVATTGVLVMVSSEDVDAVNEVVDTTV